MQVTQFSYFGIKPGNDILDASTDAGRVFVEAADATLSQPGAKRVSYGLEVENPARAWLFVDWESLEHSVNYRNSAHHAAILASQDSILDLASSSTKHIAPSPSPTLLDKTITPVTEILCAFFPPSLSAASRATATSRLATFAETALSTSAGFKGVSVGWSVEDDVPVRGGEEEGSKGILLVAFIGWESLEAHGRFRETEAFKGSIGELRTMPEMIKLAAFHVGATARGG